MKTPARVILAIAIAFAGTISLSLAEDQHLVLPAQDIQWKPGPKSLPAGAEFAVLFGDPGKEGLFAMRLKFPDGYHIPPHTHPAYEVVTVLSGTMHLGMGEVAEDSKAQTLSAASFFALPPGMAHYARAEGESVVQITTNGPRAITYISPKDDPRQTQ